MEVNRRILIRILEDFAASRRRGATAFSYMDYYNLFGDESLPEPSNQLVYADGTSRGYLLDSSQVRRMGFFRDMVGVGTILPASIIFFLVLVNILGAEVGLKGLDWVFLIFLFSMLICIVVGLVGMHHVKSKGTLVHFHPVFAEKLAYLKRKLAWAAARQAGLNALISGLAAETAGILAGPILGKVVQTGSDKILSSVHEENALKSDFHAISRTASDRENG